MSFYSSPTFFHRSPHYSLPASLHLYQPNQPNKVDQLYQLHQPDQMEDKVTMKQRRNCALQRGFFFFILLLVPALSSSPWKGAPWQSRDDGLLEQQRYNELPPTVFSPTGRLHPVERTIEQIRDLQSNLVVAVHCQDGMLILSTVPLSPYLNTTITSLRNDSTTASLFLIQNEESNDTMPIVDLSPTVVAATAGKPLDSQVLRLRIQAMSQELLEDDPDLPVKDELLATKLARSLADQLQIPTQKTNTRQGPLLAVSKRGGHSNTWK